MLAALSRSGLPTLLTVVLLAASAAAGDQPAGADEGPVSYAKQIRPLLQAHCQGCHQPAKASGEYVMTDFARLQRGGESETAAIVPGKPEESYLLDLITPTDGEAEMPKGKPPLADSQVALVRRWIAEGAKDDSPPSAASVYDAEHPPVYRLPPVITSLDYSPDGQLLAVAGFHEVLLHHVDGSGLAARLVGLSARIESVRFSPDGKRLAVTGGLPGRMGEVQVWDVAQRKLTLSVPVTFDTIYGASWSPDGKMISFGAADNTVRAIDSETGKQVLYQGAHNDWVRDTVFSVDGSHLVSVSRDRSAKLTEVATERFIDNITSITPGALKGGIAAVARHPQKDEVLVGGADGVPKLFQMYRTSKRVIGDNANLLRQFPPLEGRIFGVAFSRDGKQVAVGSSDKDRGAVRIYAYDFKTDIPKDLQAILEKRVQQRTPAEKERVEKFRKEGNRVLAETDLASGIFAVAFSPDGSTVAAAGADGMVRLISAESGDVVKEFIPVDLDTSSQSQRHLESVAAKATRQTARQDLPSGLKIVAMEVEPATIRLTHAFDYQQLLVSGKLESGETIDLTRGVVYRGAENLLDISATGQVRPHQDGKGELILSAAGQQIAVPVEVSGFDVPVEVSYVRDVMPVISKLGCNAGTCHGAKDGKNGFKLSLRGYDPLFDTRAFTDDLASRRVNLASPDDSLMLLKATGAVPHVGGQVTRPGEPYYEIVRNWIATGAKLELDVPRVTGIEIRPANPVVQKIGGRQQMRVLASYADGTQKDVTAEAFIESGSTEIATADAAGLITTVRRGEAPILARFEGNYTATTLTVMGDRDEFAWQHPPANNYIDDLVAAKLEQMKTLSSDLCTDAEFIRRVYLDLTGLPPTVDDVRQFLQDTRDSRTKRDALIDRLIGGEEYIEHWTNKWADLLQVNRKFLGVEGSTAFRDWIRQQVADNVPYDKFAYAVLTASGSNKENPAASYYKITRTPEVTMENTTQLFLAVRFNCNKCHDHPFERWTQDQYYQTAAFFARVKLERDPASGKNEIGRTAVEAGKPLYEIVSDSSQGEVTHERTGQITPPEFPFPCDFSAPEKATRREQLARWITSPDNQYFAKSYVNRVWGYLLGVGLIEPLDDIRAGNPPTNPELLERLTSEFIDSGFDVQHLMRTICRSRTYQLSIQTNRWNEDDKVNYSHAMARRLPAEVLFDAIHRVTGSVSKLPGVPPGTRAAKLPDAGVKLPSGFLDALGRPARESACECERSSGMQLGPVMALVSGPVVGEAIADPKNELAQLAASEMDDGKLVAELFLRILNRPATDEEIATGMELLQSLPEEHEKLVAELATYEAGLQPKIKQQEAARLAAIEKAKATLSMYEAQIAPREAELDRQHQEKITQAESALKLYEASLPEQFAAWEKRYQDSTVWAPLKLSDLKASNNAKLVQEDDLAVFVTGANGKGNYQFNAKTELQGITGIRLEALADKRLPMSGPGRAANGNFVLTEFAVQSAPADAADQKKPVVLQNAQADFSQQNYDIKTAIDGQQAPTNNGWATAPKFGENRTAVFETKEDLGTGQPLVLNFQLDHNYQDGQHSIGRFRVSVTTSPRPLLLNGPPPNVAKILAVSPAERTGEQQAELLKFFRGIDPQLTKHQEAVAEAKKPRPIDSRLKQLREALARAELPVPVDRRLAQLRQDVQMSQKQLDAARLTAAQDIAWALVNSPAFLFNR